MEKEAEEYIQDMTETLRRATEGFTVDTSITLAGAQLSIAISLKRIADEICGVPYINDPGADNSKHHAGITQGIQMAIEQGIANATRLQG